MTDLDRLNSAFASFAIAQRWSRYLVDELGWDAPEGAGLAFLDARAAEAAEWIEQEPAAAAEWFFDDVQSFSDHIDTALNVDWIGDIFPDEPDARLPFACLDRGIRRVCQYDAEHGRGPRSMTVEEFAERDRHMAAK